MKLTIVLLARCLFDGLVNELNVFNLKPQQSESWSWQQRNEIKTSKTGICIIPCESFMHESNLNPALEWRTQQPTINGSEWGETANPQKVCRMSWLAIVLRDLCSWLALKCLHLKKESQYKNEKQEDTTIKLGYWISRGPNWADNRRPHPHNSHPFYSQELLSCDWLSKTEGSGEKLKKE